MCIYQLTLGVPPIEILDTAEKNINNRFIKRKSFYSII